MAPEPRRKLDYSYIQGTPNDGKRYELVDGELFVNPAPSKIHQRISRRLQRQLEDYFHSRRLGEVFNAPLDVVLTPHDVFEPDLLVVSDPAHTTTRNVEKPPLLVVEVLSPSTRKVDRGVKFRRYAELGIQHCWIVDPDSNRVECFRLNSGAYRLVVEGAGDTKLSHPDWGDLVIDLATLWLQSPFS
jgi:Uma2 family endonuclease